MSKILKIEFILKTLSNSPNIFNFEESFSINETGKGTFVNAVFFEKKSKKSIVNQIRENSNSEIGTTGKEWH